MSIISSGASWAPCRQMEAETLPGLFRGSHSLSSMVDNGGAVARNQLLVCHYHAASSHPLYLVNDMKRRGTPCLDQCADGQQNWQHYITSHLRYVAEGKTQGKTFTFMMTERERRALGFVSLSVSAQEVAEIFPLSCCRYL